MKTFSFIVALALSTAVFAAEPVAPVNPHAGMGMNGPMQTGPDNPHAGMSMHGPMQSGTVDPHAGMSMHGPMLTQTGKVLSTINVPGYTYVELSQGKKSMWLAAATVAVKKGDRVRFDNGMVMNNFYSKSLKRTFPSIVFVNGMVVDNGKK